MVEIATSPDGETVQVVVTRDGFVEKGWCSSMHLTQKKINELEACIDRTAAAAFDDPLA